MDFRKRASDNFASCNRQIALDINRMSSEHSAAGALHSSATMLEGLRIFEENSQRALAQTLNETAKMIEHRGKAWDRAMSDISLALAEQNASAREILEKPLRFARVEKNESTSRAVDDRLLEIEGRLEGQLAEFRDGWTAPIAKPWKERHPNLDRILFGIIGAIIATLAGVASGFFE